MRICNTFGLSFLHSLALIIFPTGNACIPAGEVGWDDIGENELISSKNIQEYTCPMVIIGNDVVSLTPT